MFAISDIHELEYVIWSRGSSDCQQSLYFSRIYVRHPTPTNVVSGVYMYMSTVFMKSA